MPPASAVVFFAEFKRKNIDGTLLNSFNKVADTIKWKNDEDITAAAEKIGASNIIIKIYNEHLDCYSAKRLSLSNKTSYHICSRDQFFEVYETLSDNAKKFFQFLFMSPKLLFEHYCKKYSEGILESCFDLYLNDKMNELDDDVLYGPYSIIDCIVNPVVSSAIMTDINSEITNPELFWAHLEMLINYGKTTGRTHIVDFNHALTIIQKLSSTWNQLLTSSHTMNENAADTARNMHEEDTDIDRVVNIYRGIYTDVPDDYPPANDVVTGLVSNFINFNKMSRQRKLQVSNYLLNNRDVFNKTLSQSIKIVSDSIARDCDKCDGVDFSKYGLKNINTMGYKNSNRNYMEEVAKQVKDSFASVRGKQSVQKMNYIVNCFIPLMNKFKSEVMNEYGSDSSRIFSSLNNNFQMFGGDIFEDEEPAPVLEVPEPEIKYVRDASFDDMYAEAIYGGDPIINVSKGPELTAEQMVKEIIDAQIDFNKQYEQCYRELIKAIEDVHFDHVYADSLNKLYPLCRVFNDIAIKKTKTTIYLSGLYGKKNRNNAYKDVVHQTIQTLQDSKMNQFAECIRVLQKLEQLLINSANKAKDIRARFIKSPRVSSALLIVAETQVKIPCNLTNADFTAFDEAINRLYYQLRNTSSESNILNSKDEIKKYLDKVTDRAAIIKEKYDLDDQQLLYTVQKIPDVNLRNITLQVKRALNKTKLDAILYINNVVETHLTKQKMEDIHSKALTHEEIKKIEHAYLLFRRAKLTSKYKEEFKKLQKLLDENKSIFEVVNQVAKIFEASRYIEFIAMIYNELNIFGSSFNWQEFNKNMLQFMVLNSIDVVSTYRLPEATDENLQSTTPKMIIQTKEKFFMDLAELICRAGGKKEAYAKIYKILYEIASSAPYDITNDSGIKKELGIATFPCPTYKTVVGQAFKTINEKDVDGKRYKNVFNNAMGIAFKTYEDKYDNNDTIIDAVFDSLVLGVVNVIDRYWQLKYRGTLPLPMNVNMMMKGGSVFDTDEFHDVSSANVIPEAVPFYITALNVCQYYIQELVKKNDAHGLIQELKISSISVLYPIYKIFNKYHATIETLTVAQLTTCIGVLNELWNQTTGSNEMKLSASIDLLLNELNASIFLSSDLENSIIESGFGSVASFNRTMYADLDKVANIINDIYKSAAMNSYIGYSPEEQQIGFERLMHKCYVRIKDVPEAQRMTELRSMLDAHDDTNIPMHDYYKFMDLVVAPLVICYTSYNNVFNLFNVFATQTTTSSASIDLTKINIEIDGNVQNFWQYINKPGLSYKDIDMYIKDCPAVQRWNLIQFGKIIENYIKTNKLIAPNFWLPTARNTWPTQPTCSYTIHDVQGYTAALPALRSVFSEINAKTIGDYFEYAVRQFASDVDQTLHVFMSYPGLNDRIIKNIEDNLHDRLDATKILETKQDFNTLWKVFQTIKVEKSAKYIYPKWPAINIPVLIETNDSVVPPLTNSNDGGKISIIGDKLKFPANFKLEDYVSFGTSKSTVKIVTLGKNDDMCRNTWTDYAIFRLAQCHPKYQIPYKLVQMLQADPMIGKYCQPMYLNKDKAASYAFEPVATKNGHNVYNNYMTQNIIARSSLEANKAITDYSTFGQVAINSMVAILPYLISRVQNIFETTKSETKIDDGTNLRVLDECGSLIGILSKFYNEISLSVTPMMFLQEGISGYGRDHCIGELRDYIDKSIDNITDFSGLEWANKYKFVNLTSITFPDFKNKDKFEWIHKFADNIFVHPIFRQNFGIIIENIGRQAWNSIIAKSLINELSSVKKVNDAFVKQLRSILNIFVGSGSSNMDELQYLFDKSFNENMVDKLLTSSAVNDFGFRIQGGYVSEEFKKFADWQTAKIEPGELKAIDKEVKASNKPDTYINYEGWIVRYEAKDSTNTAKYYFAGYASEADANGNLKVLDAASIGTAASATIATGTNGHPPSDDGTNGYKNGKLLGHGMLTAINYDTSMGAAPAGSPTGATADHYYYKYILYDDDNYKYDLVKESRPLMKKDINSLRIVRALESGVDLSSQLKQSDGKIPDVFNRTKAPTTNVTTLYSNLNDEKRDFNTIKNMSAVTILTDVADPNLGDVYDMNANQNLFNYINNCINEIKTDFKENSSSPYIDKFIQIFLKVVSANILNDKVAGAGGHNVLGSDASHPGPAIKTGGVITLHADYDGASILNDMMKTVDAANVNTAAIWNRLYHAMYSNLDHYTSATDKTLVFDIKQASGINITSLDATYGIYDTTYNQNINLINKFLNHPVDKWYDKKNISLPVLRIQDDTNKILRDATTASFDLFYQKIEPSTTALTAVGVDIAANDILKTDGTDYTDNTKAVINAILIPTGKKISDIAVAKINVGDDNTKRNALQKELQAFALEWAIGKLVEKSLKAGDIYEDIGVFSSNIQTALQNPTHDDKTTLAGKVIKAFKDEGYIGPADTQDLRTDTLEHFITDYMALYDIYRQTVVTKLEADNKTAQSNIDTEIKKLVTDTDLAKNIYLCIKIDGYIKIIKDRVKELKDIMYDKALIDQMDDPNNYNAPINMPKDYSEINDFSKYTVGQHILNNAFGIVVREFMKYMKDSTLSKLVNHTNKVVGPNGVEADAITSSTTDGKTIPDIKEFINLTYSDETGTLEIPGYQSDIITHQCYFLLLKNRYKLQNTRDPYFRKALKTFEAIIYCLCQKYNAKSSTAQGHIFYNYGNKGASIQGNDLYPAEIPLFDAFIDDMTSASITTIPTTFNNIKTNPKMISSWAMQASPVATKVYALEGTTSTDVDQYKKEVDNILSSQWTIKYEINSGYKDDYDKSKLAATEFAINKITEPKGLFYFSIMDIFNIIMDSNLNTFIDVNIDKVENYGFLLPPRITGGIEIENMLRDPEGKDALHRMMKLYDNQYVPYRIFTTLFSSGVAFRCNSTPDIVQAAMVYFHKFNIGMSSIFNNLCFAQLFLNRNILDNVVCRLGAIVTELPIKDDTENRTTYDMIKAYVAAMIKKDGDKCSIAWNNQGDYMKHEDTDERAKIFKQEKFIADVKKDPFNMINNTYKAPSLNNNFACAFLSYTDGAKVRSLLMLPFTKAFKHLHRLDVQCTYISMLISMLKLTSFYDADYETDISYFGDQNNDPFNAI